MKFTVGRLTLVLTAVLAGCTPSRLGRYEVWDDDGLVGRSVPRYAGPRSPVYAVTAPNEICGFPEGAYWAAYQRDPETSPPTWRATLEGTVVRVRRWRDSLQVATHDPYRLYGLNLETGAIEFATESPPPR